MDISAFPKSNMGELLNALANHPGKPNVTLILKGGKLLPECVIDKMTKSLLQARVAPDARVLYVHPQSIAAVITPDCI
jgi:hypothetical protein